MLWFWCPTILMLQIHDVHYVVGPDGDNMLPASDTPFAKDKAFGFQHSNLREWVADKTSGIIPAQDVISITLDDIRRGGAKAVKERLMKAPPGSVVVVNAIEQSDLDVAVHGLLLAESEGKHLL